jgi:dephospho-CoA kinase|tara:strand:+ start:119 stop:730 length:612 start_codon:yes stop_codon:yes gene_type:complete
MLKIGITGGIGSGKSTVCNILKNLGVPVFTSDDVGKFLLNNDDYLKTQIKKIFDRDMYMSTGRLDRERMAKLVFNNPDELEKLNELVHPKVKAEFDSWCKKNEKRPYVVKEAAILFETGLYRELDKMITVFCPKEERIRRIMKRDSTTKGQIEKRMIQQITDDERNKLADYIIMNDGIEDLLPQVMELHELLLNEHTKDKVIF